MTTQEKTRGLSRTIDSNLVETQIFKATTGFGHSLSSVALHYSSMQENDISATAHVIDRRYMLVRKFPEQPTIRAT